MKRTLLPLALLFSALLSAAPLVIDSRVTVVTPESPSAVEKQAARILCRYLGEIFGTPVACVAENDRRNPGSAIFCGKKFGRFDSAPPRDAYQLFRDGGRVVLSGGDIGVLYAVYEFLERAGGVRYLGPYDVVVPRRKNLTISEDFRFAGKPFFPYRLMTLYIRNRAYAEYLSWHRVQDTEDCGKIPPELGGGVVGSPRFCHTFAHYANRFPEKKPEYFSLVNGKRLITKSTRDMGQLCLTNPELRAVMAKTLRTFIEEDRAAARKQGAAPPLLYSVEQNDNRHFCNCETCRKRLAELGNQSDVVLDFVNELAAGIAKDYPEIKLLTFAYQTTTEPPKTVKPRDNVLIQLALLGGEFENTIKDTMRSLEHPLNAEAKALYRRWHDAGFRLATWEYGVKYRQRFLVACLFGGRGLQENFRFFARNGVELVFQEGGVLRSATAQYLSFFDLHNYLFMKFMSDPDLDVDAVVDDFMKHAYGPAAAPMKKLYTLLENAMDREKRNFGVVRVPAYLDRDFFLAAEALLLEAERLTASDPACRQRVLKEYAPFGYGMLAAWEHAFGKQPFSLTKAQVAARISVANDVALRQYGKGNTPESFRLRRRSCLKTIDLCFLDVKPKSALPAELRGRKIAADFTWMDSLADFDNGRKDRVQIADDPAACQGEALRLINLGNWSPMHGVKPFIMGIYDRTARKTVASKEWENSTLPKDEAYHWFVLPGVRMPAAPQFYAHWTWVLTPVANSLLAASLTPGKVYDLWYSLKFEGPAYAPGSKKENAIFADRLLFVERE